MEQEQPILSLRGIHKSFSGVQVLNDINLDLYPGKVHCLVGENGAGKSTLIKIISGAYRPDQGSMTYQGEVLGAINPHWARVHGINAIYQEIDLIPSLSAAENISLGNEPVKGSGQIDWKQVRQRAIDILEDMGANLNVDAPVGSLKVAYQQMVAIANLKTSYSVDGRPILSVITILGFGFVESIDGVVWLRLISLTGMAIYGLTAFLIFHRFRLPLYYALLLTCFVLLNPGSGVYASWAITVAFPVSILCSLLAAVFWLECLGTGRKAFGLIAFVMLLAAFLTYQPAAFICTAVFAVKFMETDEGSSWKPIRQWVYSLMFVSFSLVAYYGVFKLYLPFVLPSSSGPLRSDIVKDYWGKLDYYVNGPLKSSFIWWGEVWKNGHGIWLLWLFIPLVLLTCGVLLKRRKWLAGGASVALFAASILLASATILVPHINTVQMRVFFPVYILTGILFSSGVVAILRRLQNTGVAWSGVSVVVATMLLCSHHYVKEGIVSPNAKEVELFESYLKQEVKEVPQYVFFIHPIGLNAVLSYVKTSHEYGLYSSWVPWVPKSMINLMLKKQFPEREIELGTIEVIQVYPWQHYEFPENAVVIDGGFVLNGNRTPHYTAYKKRYLPGVAPGRRNDPVFGNVEGLNGNWFFSDEFGFIRKLNDGRYQLLKYGVFSVTRPDSNPAGLIFKNQHGMEIETAELQSGTGK